MDHSEPSKFIKGLHTTLQKEWESQRSWRGAVYANGWAFLRLIDFD